MFLVAMTYYQIEILAHSQLFKNKLLDQPYKQ